MQFENAFPPITPVFRDRRFALVVAGTAVVQLGLVSLNLPSWECPIFRWSGIPCPGCGLTRALILLMQGDLRAALHFHAFAPVFLLAIVALILAALLPGSIVQPVLAGTELWERRTGFTIIVLAGLILYWLVRLLFVPAFAQLIRG